VFNSFFSHAAKSAAIIARQIYFFMPSYRFCCRAYPYSVIGLTLHQIIGTLASSTRQFHGKMSILDGEQKRAPAGITDIVGR
jgi:hypothetical protein